MDTKFFTEMFSLLPKGVELALLIKHDGNEMTVSVLPRKTDLKDAAGKCIVPQLMKGTPEELNEAFSNQLIVPIQKATEVLVNLSSFEKSAETAKANSKAAEDQKKQFERETKKADEYEKAKNPRAAITSLKEALKYAKDPKPIQKRIDALQYKLNSNSLFGAVEDKTDEVIEDYTNENEGE